MADSSSAETSNLSGSNHSTNFSAYTSEVESDSEVNWIEAGLSSRVVSLLDRLKFPSTNFGAYTSEVECDSEANSSEAGPSSRVVSLLDRLKFPTLYAKEKPKPTNQPPKGKRRCKWPLVLDPKKPV